MVGVGELELPASWSDQARYQLRYTRSRFCYYSELPFGCQDLSLKIQPRVYRPFFPAFASILSAREVMRLKRWKRYCLSGVLLVLSAQSSFFRASAALFAAAWSAISARPGLCRRARDAGSRSPLRAQREDPHRSSGCASGDRQESVARESAASRPEAVAVFLASRRRY